MNGKTVDSRGWEPAWSVTVRASLIGGLVAIAILSFAYPLFPYPDLPEVPVEPSAKHAKLIGQHQEAHRSFYSHNYAFAFGMMGACVGGCIGFFTVKTRKLPSLLAGAVLAAIGGALGGYFGGEPVGFAVETQEGYSLEQAAVFQAAAWCSIGFGLSLAIGLVQGGAFEGLKAAITGLVASIIGVAAYLIGASILFLRDNMVHIFPLSTAHRLFWMSAFLLVFTAVLSRGLRSSEKKAGLTDQDDAAANEDDGAISSE